MESNKISLMARQDFTQIIHSIEDLQHINQVIAVLQNDSGEKMLLESGIGAEKIYPAPTQTSLINLLIYKRYDLISYGEITTKWLLKKNALIHSQSTHYRVFISFKHLLFFMNFRV